MTKENINKLVTKVKLEYPVGTKFMCAKENILCYVNTDTYDYRIDNSVVVNGNYPVYIGNWAKIIEEEKLVKLESDCQTEAYRTCKYHNRCNENPYRILGRTCAATNGQHFPKERVDEVINNYSIF